MNNSTLSIIVPVYNAEEYLRRCIDSILAQTYTDFEVICINDGSSDSSKDILDEYVNKDPRVIIINQANKGAGAARNAGLKIMRGTYVGFVDADDWIEPVMYEKMVKGIETNDVESVACGMVMHGGTENDLAINNVFDRFYNKMNRIFTINTLNIGTTMVVWNRIYITQIIKNYNINFPDIRHYEDLYFSWIYMTLTKNIMCMNNENERFYHYCKNTKSLSSDLYSNNLSSKNSRLNLLKNLELIILHLEKYNIFYKYCILFTSELAYGFIHSNKYHPIELNYELQNIMKSILSKIDLDSCINELSNNPIYNTKNKLSFSERLYMLKKIKEDCNKNGIFDFLVDKSY